ncbi:hypothetical protein PV516_19420 [Streptomyces scabiei]|uniref:hypothetical protein n=1 Tax=Streptomyces scabiei TaxID=1930 RepID=UPI0029B7C48B|nr:hypothetical protein [Streptomyces scabiei]MDX3165960.1 hypothetical protein [Streptomyces scabiei]
MLTARPAPGTCRTVMSLYLATLDHTEPVDPATAIQAARHTELQLASLNRNVATAYIADAATTLRTDPDLHRARLAWARGLADHTARP